MTAIAGSIPLDMEIIVQVAYRFRSAKFAEPRGFTERFRVRTPDELERAYSEVEAAIWTGTLQSIHDASRPVPAVGLEPTTPTL